MKNLIMLLFVVSSWQLLGQDTHKIDLNQSIAGYQILKDVEIFPNPIKNRLNIELDDYQNCLVYLYDLNGKRVFRQKIEDDIQASFDLSNLETGTYILFIINRENRKAVNFKIQKL